MMAVSLPIGVPDPILRLAPYQARDNSKEEKNPAGRWDAVAQRRHPAGNATTHETTAVGNVYVANVPGPPTRCAWLSRKSVELVPVVSTARKRDRLA
jgi:hypothetical protein